MSKTKELFMNTVQAGYDPDYDYDEATERGKYFDDDWEEDTDEDAEARGWSYFDEADFQYEYNRDR